MVVCNAENEYRARHLMTMAVCGFSDENRTGGSNHNIRCIVFTLCWVKYWVSDIPTVVQGGV